MGFYSTYIFPRLINFGMSQETTSRYRRMMLAHAYGTILEIGFGTGLNLPFYPPAVRKIHTVDVNAGMSTIARRNIAKTLIAVEHHILDAESLPFPDESFDTVVSTWTLCSIRDAGQALREIFRVLKLQGQFIFVEHGLSHEAHIRKWQNRFTPVQKIIADGCHLNRDIQKMVHDAGFHFHLLEKSYAEGVPKVGGYLYRGIAKKIPAERR